MQVFVRQTSGVLTDDGHELWNRSMVDHVNVTGQPILHVSPYATFAQGHLQGYQVGDERNVLLIYGGRKAIARELNAVPLMLRPTGNELAFRVTRQTVRFRSVGQEATMRFGLPFGAIKHGFRMGSVQVTDPATQQTRTKFKLGNLGNAIKEAGKLATAATETLNRTSKKFTFVQIYSNAPYHGDHALGNGGAAPVSTTVLATALQAVAGWYDDV
jgi:hypothetical protein